MGSIESKKKIVFVITGTGVGGAEKMLYHTIKGLDPACYSVRLCSLKKKGVYANRLETEGVHVYSLDMKDEDTLSGWFDSLRVLMLLAHLFSQRETGYCAFVSLSGKYFSENCRIAYRGSGCHILCPGDGR